MKQHCVLRLFLVVPLLAACSLTEPRDVGKANMFGLSAQVEQVSTAKGGSLTVQLPEASSALDTYRIAVTTADGRQDYVAGARWSDFLTSLVQTSLRDGFAHSHAFQHVSDDTESYASKYLLFSEISAFEVVYAQAGAAPSVHLHISFVVKQAGSGRIVKQFSVDKIQAATENSMAALRVAFDAAISALAEETLAKIQGATR